MFERDFTLWLANHPFFVSLRSNEHQKKAWSIFAESFAPLIYSVPAFLGITLARADLHARNSLDEVWAEELGTRDSPSHPVLFQAFHRFATTRWQRFPELHQFGITAASKMVALCGSGPWPVGVAAMLAHESQFPAAYGSILPRATQDLGDMAFFFQVHATMDVEHTSASRALLRYAVEQKIVTVEAIESSYAASTKLLQTLTDHAKEALL